MPKRHRRWELLLMWSVASAGLVIGAIMALRFVPNSTLVVSMPIEQETIVHQAEGPAVPPPDPQPPQVVYIGDQDKRFGPASCPGREEARDSKAAAPISKVNEMYQADKLAAEFHNQNWQGVAVSDIRHGFLAAWGHDDIFYTRNDGKTFRKILSGPGFVYSAAVDCNGAVFAIRGNQAGFQLGYHSDGKEFWRSINLVDSDVERKEYGAAPEGMGYIKLEAVGGYLVLSGEGEMFGEKWADQLAISANGGETWTFPRPPEEVELVAERMAVLGARSDGSLEMAIFLGDCRYTGTSLASFNPEDGETNHLRYLTHYEAVDGKKWGKFYYEGNYNRYYRYGYLSEEGNDEPELIAFDDYQPSGDGHCEVYGGPKIYGHCGDGTIVKLGGSKGKVVATDIKVRFHAMDSSGRLVGISSNTLVRWSPRYGLRAFYMES